MILISFFTMEIDSSWQIKEDESTNITEIFKLPSIISPDGKIFCCSRNIYVDLINSENTSSISLAFSNNETITSIETVFTSPWIVCAGTTAGKLYFFNQTEQILELPIHNDIIQSIKVCSFRESHFTQPYPVLIVKFPNRVAITIQLDLLHQKIYGNKELDLNIQKWELHHKNIADLVVVNSNLPSPMFSGLHQFPAVFTVGSEPFICVCSISKPKPLNPTEYVRAKASRLLKTVGSWFVGTEPTEEEPPIPKSTKEWELYDEGRIAKCVAADPTGRWLAITDEQGRVIIVDVVFGHVAKVLKGLRDAQVAWIDGENIFLVIYAPFRGMLIACEIPKGSIHDAVKVERGGKLYQSVSDGKYRTSFIDSKGNVLNLKMTSKIERTPPEETLPPSSYHFMLPTDSQAQ